MRKSVNYEIARDIIKLHPAPVIKALERNCILTSSWVLSFGTLRIYKEGFYLTLEGTRCKVSIWAYDNDGELIYGRKPWEDNLHYLYEEALFFNSGDFEFLMEV